MIAEIIGSIVAGLAATTRAAKIGNDTVSSRNNAIRNNEAYYFDGENKRRATSTNEPVTMQYLGGQKLVGLKTGKVYRDYDAEKTYKFLYENNKRLEEKGSRVFYKQCPEYFDRGQYRDIHLYERSTGRPYSILAKEIVDHNTLVRDESRFIIVYLDENNGMKSTGEYAYIPKEYYYDYKFG